MVKFLTAVSARCVMNDVSAVRLRRQSQRFDDKGGEKDETGRTQMNQTHPSTTSQPEA